MLTGWCLHVPLVLFYMSTNTIYVFVFMRGMVTMPRRNCPEAGGGWKHATSFDVIKLAHKNKIKQVVLFSYVLWTHVSTTPRDAGQAFRRVRTTLFCTDEFSDRLPISGWFHGWHTLLSPVFLIPADLFLLYWHCSWFCVVKTEALHICHAQFASTTFLPHSAPRSTPRCTASWDWPSRCRGRVCNCLSCDA